MQTRTQRPGVPFHILTVYAAHNQEARKKPTHKLYTLQVNTHYVYLPIETIIQVRF